MDSLNNFGFSTCSRTHGEKKTVKKKGVEYHHGPGKVRRVVGGGQKRGGEGQGMLTTSPLLHSVYMCTYLHTYAHTHTVITSDKQLAEFCYGENHNCSVS